MKVTTQKGFVSAEVKALPKGISVFSQGMADGVYLVASNFLIKYDSYYSGISAQSKAKRSIPAGTVILSTEGGHYYRMNAAGNGFSGLGKRNGTLDGCLVQRVSITSMEIGPYKAIPTKKPVTKKKVAKKKKVTKKKVVRKK